MRIAWQRIWLPALAIALAACGKQASLEGKVTDGRGLPLADIKVIAEQTEPQPGYARFETRTGADGLFHFSKLWPNAEYTLIPSSEHWLSADPPLKIHAASDGQHLILPQALALRYKRSAEGTIIDSQSGLEWLVGGADAKSWDEARHWAESLRIAGGGWRMPAGEELKTIQHGDRKKPVFDPVFRIDNCVWSVEQKSAKVWVIDRGPYNGQRYYAPAYYGPGNYAAPGGPRESSEQQSRCRGVAMRLAKL